MAKKDTPIRHSQLTVFPHCKTAVHAHYVALQFADGCWRWERQKVNYTKLVPGTWLTIRLVKVVIEPADVFGIINAICQVLRCIPLRNGSEHEHGKRVVGWCACVVRTIGVRRGLEFRQLTNAEAGVLMAVAFGGIVQSVGVGPASE